MPLPKAYREVLLNGGIDQNEHAEAQGDTSFRDVSGYRFGELGKLEATPDENGNATWTLSQPSWGAGIERIYGDPDAHTIVTREDEVAVLTKGHGLARLVGSSSDWVRALSGANSATDGQFAENPVPVDVRRWIVASAQLANNSEFILAATCTKTHGGDVLVAWIEYGSSTYSSDLNIRVYDPDTGALVSTATETLALTGGAPIQLVSCPYGVSGAEGALVVYSVLSGAPRTVTARSYLDSTRALSTTSTDLTTNADLTSSIDVATVSGSTSGFYLAYVDNTSGFLTVETRTLSAVSSTHTSTHAASYSRIVADATTPCVVSVAGAAPSTVYYELIGTPAGVVSNNSGANATWVHVDAARAYSSTGTNVVLIGCNEYETTTGYAVNMRWHKVELDGTPSRISTGVLYNCFLTAGMWYSGGRAFLPVAPSPSDSFNASLWHLAAIVTPVSGLVLRMGEESRFDKVARYAHQRLLQWPAGRGLANGGPTGTAVIDSDVAVIAALMDLPRDEQPSGSRGAQTLALVKVDLDALPVDCIETDGCVEISAGVEHSYDGVVCEESQPLDRPIIYYGGAAGALGCVATYEWVDNKGRLHRSQPSAAITTLTAGQTVYVSIPPAATRYASGMSELSVKLWVTDGSTSTYYLANDAGGDTDDYDSVSGSHFAFTSVQTGSSSNPTLYSQSELASMPPPTFCSKAIVGDRHFAVDAEDRQRWWCSKPLVAGYAVEWNTALTGRIPEEATAVVSLGGYPAFVCRGGVYLLAGEGPDNTGRGTYAPPRKISTLGTALKASVCEVGSRVAFLAQGGYVLLGADGSAEQIGSPVSTILTQVACQDGGSKELRRTIYDRFRDELRVVTSTETYYCSLANGAKWTRSPSTAVDVALDRNGRPYGASGTAVWSEKVDTDGGTWLASTNARSWKTPWLRLEGIVGFGRLWSVVLLLDAPSETASLGSDTGITITLRGDYDDSATVTTWTIPGSEIATWTAGKPKAVTLRPTKQKLTSIKLEMSESFATANSGFAPISARIEYGVDERGARGKARVVGS